MWGRSAFDSDEDLGEFRCLVVEILKNAKNAKEREFGFDFRRFAFVSTVGSSWSVRGHSVVDSCEELAVFCCLEGEIW